MGFFFAKLISFIPVVRAILRTYYWNKFQRTLNMNDFAKYMQMGGTDDDKGTKG